MFSLGWYFNGLVLPGTRQCWIAGMEILSRDQLFQSWWSTWGIYCKPTSVRYMKCILWLLKLPPEPHLYHRPPENTMDGYWMLEPWESLSFLHCSQQAVGTTGKEEWFLLQEGHPELAAKDYVQAAYEDLQGGRVHRLMFLMYRVFFFFFFLSTHNLV